MAKHDLSAALDLAERLATFANLAPDDAAAFRKRHTLRRMLGGIGNY